MIHMATSRVDTGRMDFRRNDGHSTSGLSCYVHNGMFNACHERHREVGGGERDEASGEFG